MNCSISLLCGCIVVFLKFPFRYAVKVLCVDADHILSWVRVFLLEDFIMCLITTSYFSVDFCFLTVCLAKTKGVVSFFSCLTAFNGLCVMCTLLCFTELFMLLVSLDMSNDHFAKGAAFKSLSSSLLCLLLVLI